MLLPSLSVVCPAQKRVSKSSINFSPSEAGLTDDVEKGKLMASALPAPDWRYRAWLALFGKIVAQAVRNPIVREAVL